MIYHKIYYFQKLDFISILPPKNIGFLGPPPAPPPPRLSLSLSLFLSRSIDRAKSFDLFPSCNICNFYSIEAKLYPNSKQRDWQYQ